MSALTGDYLTLAEAVGEQEPQGLAYTAEDMDGWDEDDFLAADLAMERDMADRQRRLEDENAALREEVSRQREYHAEWHPTR